MSTESTTLEILIKLKDETTQAMNGVISNLGNFQKSIEPAANASKAFGLALLGVGAAGITGIGIAVKAAAEAEESMSKVTAIVKAMGVDFEKTTSAIEAAAAATVKFGFDDEDAAVSIAQLYQRTGDLTKAVQLNVIAMDLSRAKNIDLLSASKMVGMVLSGNAKLLKQYGIELDDTKTPLEALDELQRKVTGSAQEFSNTFNGQIATLKIQLANLTENLGGQFLPLLTSLATQANYFIENVLPVWIEKTQEITKWLQDHQIVIYAVAGAIAGALAPAIISMGIAFVTAIPGIIAAGVALTVAFAPWILGGALIGAFIAGIVWIVQNWSMISQKATEIFGNIANTITSKVEFIKSVTLNIFESLRTGLTDIWNGILSTIKGAINGIISAVNGMIGGINSIKISVPKVEYWPGQFFGGFDIGFPQIPTIPYLARGGIVTSPTLAMIGEAGPEAVVPLNRYPGANIVVNITGNNISNKMDLRDIADEVSNQIMNKLRLNGRVAI